MCNAAMDSFNVKSLACNTPDKLNSPCISHCKQNDRNTIFFIFKFFYFQLAEGHLRCLEKLGIKNLK